MNIFEELKTDHKTQRSLANTLLRTEGETEERKSIYEKLRDQLKLHAKSEERFFYKPLMEFDMSQEKARHSVAEHHDIDEMIEKLDSTEMSSPAWMTYFRQLRELVIHHLDEEENEVFQIAGRVLSNVQKEKLGSDYRKMMDEENA